MSLNPFRTTVIAIAVIGINACSAHQPCPDLGIAAVDLPAIVVVPPPLPVPPRPAPVIPPPRLAIALGGGAARGFAHVGVIKMLETQGIRPDIVVGASAGSVVGALYASGVSGFELQRMALDKDEKSVSDWVLPNRGFIRGESLQNFINKAVQNRTIDKLGRTLGIVATDLLSGEQVVFRYGNTGLAVRASSSVPGVFQPVMINGREYVDGGLTSPVPVRAARDLGADIVIAVDISRDPQWAVVSDSVSVLLQTFNIMGRSLAAHELPSADVVISPGIRKIGSTSFESRNLAILEGERAALAAVPKIREKIAEREVRLRKAALAN